MKETEDRLETTNQDQLPPFIYIWTRFKSWVRRDWFVIVLFAITTILMSYPLAFKLGGDWLALGDTDTYVKLWDNWWLQNSAFKEPSLFFTDLEFHPAGLDLSHHSISWTISFLSWPLALLTNAITAYNLTILFALFTTAYAAYLLVVPITQYRAAAWLAGAIYSYAPYHLLHSGGHPDLVHLAPIPLAVLLLFTAFTKPSILAALGAAVMVGLAAFTSLYIMVFALITVGPIFLFLLIDRRRWKQRNIWPAVIVFLLVTALLLGIRLIPVFRNAAALTAAIDLKYSADRDQTDLLSYILPSHKNPLFSPYTEEIATRLGDMNFKWPAYLGIVPIALSIVALTWKKHRKIVLLWSSIGLLFVILSLGPLLRINGNLFENIVLPSQYLSWFAPIRAVGRPGFYVIGVLLPLAVLAAIGFDRLLIGLVSRRKAQIALMITLPCLLLVEYWSGEFPGESSAVNPIYEQIAQEPGDFAIIQLPMGRTKSKRYMYLQTIHQKKIVEGLSARTPDEAYQYIRSNPLLLNWSEDEPLDSCLLSRQQIILALDELIDDDFVYVIVHHSDSNIPFQNADDFSVEPFYQDNNLTAYKLADLRLQPPCQDIYERVTDLPSPESTTSISWDQKIALLGYHLPEIDPDSGLLPITLYWQALTEMENSYTAYFHIIDSETGTLVAQADVIPRGWTYPTSWWTAGEVVEDTVNLPMEDLPPGHYDLHIGWYNADTGSRLPPSSDHFLLLPGNSTLLTVLEK